MVHDLRVLLRAYAGRNVQSTAVVLESRTLQSTPESARAPATMARSERR